MDTFEINNGEEINVEEIMGKIRENIRKRKGAGAFSEKSVDLHKGSLPEGSFSENNTRRDLDYLNSNWDTQNSSYFISSHRPVVGRYLIKGRELVHGEVRRYVDPVVWKQSEFNRSAVKLLNDVSNRLDQLRPEIDTKIDQLRPEIDTKIDQLRPEIDTKIDQLRPEIDTKIDQLRPEIDTKIDQLRPEIDTKIDKLRLEINKKIDLLRLEFLEKIMNEIDMAISSIDSKTDNKECSSIVESKIEEDFEHQKTILSGSQNLEINYVDFENKFRGSSEDIKGRQSKFMNYFAGCSNVLDIGSGRGEFLELAKEQGVGAKGVDIDDDMVIYCLIKGLDVEKNDAIQYLEKLEDNSLDGVFIDQVVEHLEASCLIKLLKLCYQKLNFGYHIVVETVNPLSFFSFANFYIDLTHVRPVHPETLKFLIKSSGFRDLDMQFISPVEDEARLQKLPVFEEMDERKKADAEIYNHNIELLNYRLYGPQDYVIVGKK